MPAASVRKPDGAGSSRTRWAVSARSVEDSGGVTIVPALSGLGAPHWNPDARGVIWGLTRGTTRAHIARAALEAIALQNVDLLGAMEKDRVGAYEGLKTELARLGLRRGDRVIASGKGHEQKMCLGETE